MPSVKSVVELSTLIPTKTLTSRGASEAKLNLELPDETGGQPPMWPRARLFPQPSAETVCEVYALRARIIKLDGESKPQKMQL